MNKILLITTKGCEGCSIMNTSIHNATLRSSKEFEFEVKDVKDLDRKFVNKLHLKDFPTTILFKDDVIIRKEIGSRPPIVVLRWIDIDFK